MAKRITRREFVEKYNKELDILFNDDDKISEKAHIYGYPVRVSWNGYYCDCGDGAAPSNHIIPAIKACDEEWEGEEWEDSNLDTNDDYLPHFVKDKENIRTIRDFELNDEEAFLFWVDEDDEWMLPTDDDDANVGVRLVREFSSDDLYSKFAEALGVDWNSVLESDGYMDIYAIFSVVGHMVKKLYVKIQTPSDALDAYIYLKNHHMEEELYTALYCHSHVSFHEDFLAKAREIEMKKIDADLKDIINQKSEKEKKEMNEKETTIENFMEALDIFQKAFENLASYAGSYYIKDEWWDGKDNYPFNWSFDEMPGVVEVWVEGVKAKANEECYVHGTYELVVDAEEVVPEWKDPSNMDLFLVEFEGEILFDWYCDKIALHEDQKTPKAFNTWIEDECDAMQMQGAYEYCKQNVGGIISVRKTD